MPSKAVKNDPDAPSIFEYMDFRTFLADTLASKRIHETNFSLRAFALKAGLPLSNSSFFAKVISGKRNLTLDLQFQFAKALKLPPNEIKYFALLVQFNQSKDAEGKKHLQAELSKYIKSKARSIAKDSNGYYSRWQNPVVRAFFGIEQRENNPAAIGKRIFPQVAAKEVEEAVKILLQFGLISKTANGYALRDSNIATERENKDGVGKVRIEEMLRLALEGFHAVDPDDREYSAMTVYVSKQGYETIREKIKTFREEIKSLVSADEREDRIYTLGMQFFPNSQLPEWKPNARKP